MLKLYYCDEDLETIVLGMFKTLEKGNCGGKLTEKFLKPEHYIRNITTQIGTDDFLYNKFSLDRYESESIGDNKLNLMIIHIFRMMETDILETVQDLKDVLEAWLDRWGGDDIYEKMFPNKESKVGSKVDEDWSIDPE